MKVGIASDHGGFELKEELVAKLRAAGHTVTDFGAHSLALDDDYPDFVVPLSNAVADGEVERGIAICGSGVGASVCANKVKGIRAALIHDHFSARLGCRGRPHEHSMHGRTDCGTGGGLGSRPGLPGSSVQPGRTASAPLGEDSDLGGLRQRTFMNC